MRATAQRRRAARKARLIRIADVTRVEEMISEHFDENFSRKGAKTQRQTLNHVFLCVFAPLREKFSFDTLL